jgi:hypothetical protein
MTPKQWLAEIDEARKREEDWRKDVEKILEIYEGESAPKTPFNILYSNVETLSPALYSATPRPSVRRRWTRRPEPIEAAAAAMGTRMGTYLIDTNSADYASFDSTFEDATHSYLLCGRADPVRVRFDAQIEMDAAGEPQEAVEKICFESVKWDRWGMGPGRKWTTLPWIYFLHYLTKGEAKRRFGELAEKLQYSEDEEDKKKPIDERKEGVTLVYEVWEREGKRVLFLSEHVPDAPLRETPDPLGLSGFFPMAEPPRAVKKSNDLAPTPPYNLYREQAEELNEITRRIKKLTAHMKVRGAYDGRITELEEIFKKEDGEMIAASGLAQLQDSQGLERHLWFVPIDKIMTTLRELLPLREQVKQTIYEITGIADVIRGASAASETLGAQELKERWVTLRLKRMQKDIQRYVRDTLRLALEAAFEKLRPETIGAIVELGLPNKEDKMRAQQGLMMAQQSGQPPPPELEEALRAPALEDVIALLANDSVRRYRIDVETNSTVEVEATQDKQEISEFMNAMAQFLNGAAPAMESGTLPFDAAKSILLQITRKFRFGEEVEEAAEARRWSSRYEGPAGADGREGCAE